MMVSHASTEASRIFRKKQKEQGLSEVRGIWLPSSLHPKLKAQAKKLAEKQL